jgi:hypothetical protein
MDATITYDEVAAFIGPNITLLEPCPTFESSRVLSRHFECTLQCLPCPQSTHLGWKGLVMLRVMYALLTVDPFCTPNNPGLAADYTRTDPADLTPLTLTKQATVDNAFAHQKHCFHSMQNIERDCFTALNASINNAFKVSNNPTIIGWRAGMSVQIFVDQLSNISCQLTLAAMKLNNLAFCSQYSAANAHGVLFRRITNCAKIAIFGSKSLHGLPVDQQHDPSSPHNWPIPKAIQGVGQATACRPDVDCLASPTPRGFPALPQRDGTHCRPPRICPHPSIQTECIQHPWRGR